MDRADPLAVMEPAYTLRTSSGAVQAWSTARLPFEPRGKQIELRSELRAALQSLVPAPGLQLHAVYGADEDKQVGDTENVLLYNVGTAAFRHLARHAVVFERTFTFPPPPEGSGIRRDRLHYQRYTLEPIAGPHHWRRAGTIASFEGVDVSSLKKPGPVWAAIRTHGLLPSSRAEAPVRFLVRLKIRDRRPTPTTSLAGLIKPVLDGVISAFHSHMGDTDQVSRRLADAVVGEQVAIRSMLADPNWGALGPRTLVKSFGTGGVQWNPADDYCMAAAVVLDPTPGAGPRWQLSGKLMRAVPR